MRVQRGAGAGRRDGTRVEEEPELPKEVSRGAPAAAVCGEDGGQDSDAPGRAKEVTGGCTALGTSALVVFYWTKRFGFVFFKTPQSGRRRAGRVMENPWKRRRTLWLRSSLLLCLVTGEFV